MFFGQPDGSKGIKNQQKAVEAYFLYFKHQNTRFRWLAWKLSKIVRTENIDQSATSFASEIPTSVE